MDDYVYVRVHFFAEDALHDATLEWKPGWSECRVVESRVVVVGLPR